MATTPQGLPYPVPTDPLTQGADAIKALAQAIEDGLTLTGDLRTQTDLRSRVGLSSQIMLSDSGGKATIYFGTAFTDLLWLDAPAQLVTSANFTSNQSMWAKGGTVFFGADASIRRDAADSLRTDDQFTVGYDVAALATGDTGLWLQVRNVGIRRVIVGPVDSGGTGFRALRVIN